MLSVRRVPALLAGVIGRIHLDDALNAALADPSLGAGPQRRLPRGRTGPGHPLRPQPTAMLIPASGLKLLTGTAILDKLGPDARLVTTVAADRAPAGGVVTGNLYLVGGGDPLLRTADYVATLRCKELVYTHLDDLARAVRAAGVTHVTGAVVGDESRYDTERDRPQLEADVRRDRARSGPSRRCRSTTGSPSSPPNGSPPPSPAQTAAAVFTALLKATGVAVDGPAPRRPAPAAASP